MIICRSLTFHDLKLHLFKTNGTMTTVDMLLAQRYMLLAGSRLRDNHQQHSQDLAYLHASRLLHSPYTNLMKHHQSFYPMLHALSGSAFRRIRSTSGHRGTSDTRSTHHERDVGHLHNRKKLPRRDGRDIRKQSSGSRADTPLVSVDRFWDPTRLITPLSERHNQASTPLLTPALIASLGSRTLRHNALLSHAIGQLGPLMQPAGM